MDNITDVTELPIWTPWVMVEVAGNDNMPEGKPIQVGGGMTKNQAWELARVEMEKRPDTVAMAVRRDKDLF